MIGMPPPEPDPDDTYQWANAEHTLIAWHQAGPPEQTLYVPVTPEGTPANADWTLLSGWIDAGLILVADPPPPPQPGDPVAEPRGSP